MKFDHLGAFGTYFSRRILSELQLDVIMWWQKLIDAAVKQQKKLQDLSIYVPSHIPERMSMLGLDTNRW